MDYEERSPLWGIGATTAAASGLGMSIYSSRNELLAALRVADRDVAAETANIASQMDRYNMSPAAATMNVMDEHQAGILSLKGNKRLAQQDIAQAAYESILSGRRVSHDKAYSAFQNILKQPDILSSYSAAGNSVRSLQGDFGIMSSRMEDIVYNQDIDHSEMISSPGDYSTGRSSASRSDISNQTWDEANRIKKELGTGSGGTKVKWSGIYNVPDELAGERVITPMLKGRIAGKAVNIPLVNTGLTYGGDNLTARYVTRGAYDESGKGFNYIERYTSMLKEVMDGRQSQSATNRSIHSVNTQLVGMLNERDSAARAQAVWSMPESVLPSGGRAKAQMVGLQAVSMAGEGFSESNVANLIDKGLYPMGSPDVVAKGTMYKGDIAKGLYGPLGEWFPVEKRPDQFIRPEFGVTAEAKALASDFKGAFGEGYSRLDRKIKGELYDKVVTHTGYTAPQLTTFYAKAGGVGFQSDALNQVMFAEQAFIAEGATDMMEYERIVQKKISVNEDFRLNKDISDTLKGAEMGEVKRLGTPVGGGKFLGIEQGTGKELWSNAVGSGRTDVIAAEMTGKDAATIYTRERHKLKKGDFWKFFSEESKFLGTAASSTKMKDIMKAAGAGDIAGGVAGQKLEAIYSSKLLEKNTFARIQQQTEAMSMFAGENIDKNKLSMRRRLLAKEFMADPMASLGVKELLASGADDAELQLEKNMVALSNQFKLNKSQMGLTFGLMDQGIADNLGIGSAVRASTGVVGLSKMRLGDLATDGVGNLASMEQSGFRLLAMKGEEGQRMAAELAGRLVDKGELAPAEKMLASVVNESDKLAKFKGVAGLGGVATDERTLSQLKPSELIAKEGRFVELGTKVKSLGRSHQIYIPGTDEASGMMLGTTSPKGKHIESPVAKELINLQRAIKSKDDQMIESAGISLRGAVHQSYESQGAARGKIVGSRFLTGIRQTVADSTDDAFGISRQNAKGMFDELIDKASSDKQRRFLTSQKDKLLSGQTVSGGVWRHPTTGPESFQFVNYKVDKGIKGDLISAPAKFGTIALEGGSMKQVDFSQMVGMKGDFDKDMYALSVIGDEDTASSVGRNLKSGVAQENYNKYLFNHYALEETIGSKKELGAKISQMNRIDSITGGARKLTEAKIATPQVNVALQKLKIGLQYSAPEKYRPLSELFWHLEEAAIGGKHGVMEGSLYQNIASAVETKDANRMEGVLTGLLGEQRTVKGTLTLAGRAVEQSLNIDPTEWAKTAINSAANVSDEVDIAYRSAQIAKGKQPLREVNEIVEMMYKRKAGSLDVAQSLMYAQEKNIGSSLSQGANRMMRKGTAKMSAVGRVLNKAKGPAMIGLAAAAGIAFMAPSVSGSLKTDGPRGGRGVVVDDMGPPGGPGINPPPPRIMSSPKVYDMSRMRSGTRANIRMSLGDANSSSENLMGRVRDLANNGNVNIRTVDDRSVLDAQRLANKIHERL